MDYHRRNYPSLKNPPRAETPAETPPGRAVDNGEEAISAGVSSAPMPKDQTVDDTNAGQRKIDSYHNEVEDKQRGPKERLPKPPWF